MMPEAEAWRYLQGLWEKTDIPCVIVGTMLDNQDIRAGLCGCIHSMFQLDMIDRYVRSAMLDRITCLPGFLVTPLPMDGVRFLWPISMEGARQRAEFCQQQVEECAKGGRR
jgi:hypothetical protein